ncbi:MAG: hypothetical protein IPI83_14710 [Sphingomonadales bacterium]|nr:hypothetical protein [Sphingomonadales bacterium]
MFRSPMADGQLGFVVTRYEDVKTVYANAVDFSNAYAHVLRPAHDAGKRQLDEEAESFDYNKYASFLLTEDDPIHAKRRDLVAAVFRAKSVNDLTPAIHARCDRIIDSFIARGEADLINDFAVPARNAAPSCKSLGLAINLSVAHMSGRWPRQCAFRTAARPSRSARQPGISRK